MVSSLYIISVCIFIVFMGFSQFWEVRGAAITLRGPYLPCIAFYVIVR
nr:MAG TPA: hypothetical protein [Caudoviricetes sp.]